MGVSPASIGWNAPVVGPVETVLVMAVLPLTPRVQKKGSSWIRVGEFRVWRVKKAVHFIAILDFGAASDLASEMDGKNGEATSATVGCV